MRKPWRVNNDKRELRTFVFYSPQRVADPRTGFKMPAYRGAMLD